MKETIKQLAEQVAHGFYQNNPHNFYKIKDSIRKALRNCSIVEDEIDFLNHYIRQVRKDIEAHRPECTHPVGCMIDSSAEFALGAASELLMDLQGTPKRRPTSTGVSSGNIPNITITGGSAITFNFGTLNDINNNIQELQAEGNGNVSLALQDLTKAVEQATELANQDKTELLELLRLVSEEAVKPKGERIPSIAIKSMINGGLAALNGLGSLSTIAGQTVPQLLAHFA